MIDDQRVFFWKKRWSSLSPMLSSGSESEPLTMFQLFISCHLYVYCIGKSLHCNEHSKCLEWPSRKRELRDWENERMRKKSKINSFRKLGRIMRQQRNGSETELLILAEWFSWFTFFCILIEACVAYWQRHRGAFLWDITTSQFVMSCNCNCSYRYQQPECF